jgi:hypothetical protein
VTWRSVLRVVVRRHVVGTERTERETEVAESADSFREIEVVNWPAARTESLERTLDRAESVLEGQLTELTDIDDKTVKTVRIGAILFGAVVSSSQLVPGTLSTNVWMEVGGVLVLGSMVVGIFTYSTSSPDYGPDPSYVRSNIESGEPNEDVYLELLQGYRKAITTNRRIVNDSTRYLFVTQILLAIGIIARSIGAFVL